MSLKKWGVPARRLIWTGLTLTFAAKDGVELADLVFEALKGLFG